METNPRPGKGIPYLLAAIKELGAESKVHLLLIGDLKSGVDVSLLKDPIVASKVHLIGFQTDVGSIVAKCNAAVMASERREGLCKSVIESMSVGVPTIVTAIGGMKEIVSNERDGLIIEPRSSQAISAAINKLIQDPKRAQEFGVAGRETIVKKFGLPRAIRETIAVYDEVLTS